MKKKPYSKKLTLSKQTVADLRVANMEVVKGGAIYTSPLNPYCIIGTDAYCITVTCATGEPGYRCCITYDVDC